MSQNMFNTNPEPIKNILDSLNLNNINYGDIANRRKVYCWAKPNLLFTKLPMKNECRRH